MQGVLVTCQFSQGDRTYKHWSALHWTSGLFAIRTFFQEFKKIYEFLFLMFYPIRFVLTCGIADMLVGCEA